MYSKAEMSSKASVWGNKNIFVWKWFLYEKEKISPENSLQATARLYIDLEKPADTNNKKELCEEVEVNLECKIVTPVFSIYNWEYLEVLHASVVDELFSNLTGGGCVEVEIHQHQKQHLGQLVDQTQLWLTGQVEICQH